MITLIVFAVIFFTAVIGLIMPTPRFLKSKPTKYNDWDNYSLTNVIESQYPAKGSVSELENWWNANKSKDARIKELESKLKQVREDHAVERERFKRFALNSAQDRIATTVLSDPSKAMVLPDNYSLYDITKPTRVGLNIEGPLADMIMDTDSNRVHTVRIKNGKVLDWDSSWY